MSRVLILGAASDTARAFAHRYAENGFDLYLAAHKPEDVSGDESDIKIRYRVDVETIKCDVTDFASHDEFYGRLNPKPDGVVCFAGYTAEQETAQKKFDESKKIIETNYTGYVSLLNIIANDFESRREGFIIGVSSVAGDRGRKSNYIYGSAKAGFTAYLSGLRNRLYKSGVQVLTVKPGFLLTKMTDGTNLPKKLTVNPREAAQDIFEAQRKGKDIIYTKWFWRFIMAAIACIPENIFKRMKF
ncbi:MAG: short-chain dehydrogenase [bacterium]|nr:MAG: short-chain dehydrogenase [bacterium]